MPPKTSSWLSLVPSTVDSETIDLGGPRDTPWLSPHTEEMSDLSREELKAHFENQNLKVDARLKDFESRVADGITQMNHSLQLLEKDLASFRGVKATIIINSIVSVIAIVGIVIAVMSYGVASFDSGRDTSALIQELKQQNSETKNLLEQLKKQQTQ